MQRITLLILGLLVGLLAPSAWADQPRPNVLFIAIDDLNDWVGHLGGHPQAKTPHIDRLAQRGVTFYNAHCAAPVCNPSRAALLSGLRPSTSGVYSNGIDWRPLISHDTLPLTFRKNGYYVAGAGKIYHGAFPRDSDWDDYLRERPGRRPARADGGVGGIRFAPLDADDRDTQDFQTVEWISRKLNEPRDKPFFLACGLHKPHMPWNVPRKYYDLHPLEKIELPRVLETDLDDIPPAGVAMARPQGDHRDIVQSGRWKDAVQAYLAAGSYCDAMVGRLIEALDKSPHRQNTILVLWGDHGWHLGEKLHWRKFTLWEEATRSPLIFVAPGVTPQGGVCKRSVDFMSIYPTLCDLCGLAIPEHVEGVSLRKLLADPAAEWERPAITTHGRANHAVRTEKWRYIRYADGSEELYDESADPMEWTNLASQPQYAQVKAELAKWLPKQEAPAGPARQRGGE
jgi:arylsulfatase A-like enzyme